MVLPAPIRSARTLVEVFRAAAEVYGDRAAFCPRQPDGTYGSCSFRELHETGLNLATALIELGVRAGEGVAILADNRLEWIVADFGIQFAGAFDVPRGTDVTAVELDHILNHAEVRVAFVQNEAMAQRLRDRRPQLPRVRTLVLMARESRAGAGEHTLWSMVERGAQLRAAGDRGAEERMAAVKPDDLFTLIYTSGTTGRPKGVQLTHANMVSQVHDLPITLRDHERFLSILPIWHSYERVAEMIAIGHGATTYYTSVRTVSDDLKVVQPTFMTSAPRVWESVYQKIISGVAKAPPLRRAMFRVAYFFSWRLRRSAYFVEGRRLDLVGRRWWQSLALGLGHAGIYLVLLLPYLIMDGLVTRKLRGIFGGRFRCTVSGGGALPPHVDEFFNYIGIPVLEGYGLTESCPVLAVRTWPKRVIGTVGPAWPRTEFRIVDLTTGAILYPDPTRADRGRGRRGELHARGPQIMKGYYKDPELTERVLKDGWLATGDIALITFNDCVKIVGRCKETIVLLNGENIEPAPIENKLCESPYILQCIVVGQDQKHLGALITTSPELFQNDGIAVASVTELAAHPAVQKIIAREIRARINGVNGFKAHEQIQVWRLLPKAFEVGDELTATYKLKRHVIDAKYAEVLAQMFPPGGKAGESPL
jgi:long-chain acyl-CoA synthetase